MKKEQPIEITNEEKNVNINVIETLENCKDCKREIKGDNVRVKVCKTHIEMINNA